MCTDQDLALENNLSESILVLFEAFKKSSFYTDETQMDIDWLKEKITLDEMEELERYIYAIMLKNEEKTFISSSKFMCDLHRELYIKTSV